MLEGRRHRGEVSPDVEGFRNRTLTARGLTVHPQEANFWSRVKSYSVELGSGRAVADGARLGRDVRGRVDNHAPLRAARE